jgi:hypothetical protein
MLTRPFSMSIMLANKSNDLWAYFPASSTIIGDLFPVFSMCLLLLANLGTDATFLLGLGTFLIFCSCLLRDSFITAVCKASLPPHYTLSVLKATPSTQLVSAATPHHHLPGDGGPGADSGGGGHWEGGGDYRHQVVAVGTPLPTASLPPSAQQGPVMLTAKNLQCMRAILSIAHCHGDLLGPAWHIVLTTLQHLGTVLPPSSPDRLSTIHAASRYSCRSVQPHR